MRSTSARRRKFWKPDLPMLDLPLLDPLACLVPASTGPVAPPLPRRFLLTPSPDHPDDYILHLDYSHGLSPYLECPRRWENLNIHAREANKPTVAKDFGTLFHACEELRLREGFSPALREKQRKMVSDFFIRHPVPHDEYRHADRMLDTLARYEKQYLGDGWPEAVLVHEGQKAVELPFKIELCTVEVNATLPYSQFQLTPNHNENVKDVPQFVRRLHVFYTGKIDAVLTNSNLLWVIDHKTSSRGGKEFEEAFRLSLQTRGYCWAAQKILGLSVAGLTMNAVIVRPLTKTGTGTKLKRVTYFYSPESLTEWEAEAIDTVEAIVSSLHKGFFRRSARSFKSPCAGCDFQENCTLPPEQRAADLASGLYSDVTWSPTNESEFSE